MPKSKRDHSAIAIEGKEDDQEKRNRSNIKELLHLLDQIRKRGDVTDEDLQKLRTILINNKSLINYQHCKENKLRSILHIVKYDSKSPYEVKQKIINTIVDVGYELYKFSESTCLTDNCYAFFFIAAKSDFTKLKDVILYFKEKDYVEKLHDTREGDTVLSFMLKFGDHVHRNYDDTESCFELLLKEHIDPERIDYYKNNVNEIIEKEKSFLQRREHGCDHTKNLERIQKFIKNNNEICNDPVIVKLRTKYELFESVINKDINFKVLLQQNLELRDADDGENTLLQLAIIKNILNVTKELLQKGANPNHIVRGRNEEMPIVLAAKLNRDDIFREILENQHLHISRRVYIKFVTEVKPKFLNYLLESNNLNVNHHHNDKTPLYYAIVRKNKKAIQTLLQRGASLPENCLNNINPKDLEDYMNSCIKFDNFSDDMEESDYKSFLVFDFFINSNNTESNFTELHQDPNNESESENETTFALSGEHKTFVSEIQTIRRIGSNKRLKHLLEHPLIYIFIILKWYCVLYYYYCFVVFKSIFYATITLLVYLGSLNFIVVTFVVLIQIGIVYFNFAEFKCEFRRYTLHFLLEILILLLLLIICILSISSNTSAEITEVSAFIIIFISISILLTLGYHINLSKWMSMAKRVFKNFCILLIFFTLPILAFATAFKLLLPVNDGSLPALRENEDFENLPRAIFRTFVMLGGDLGDKRFFLFGGYIAFLLFSIGMAIIIMNFWTGVAVSDIKEIEEQSTVVAFNNVIIFIEGVEKLYNFLLNNLLKYWFSSRLSHFIRTKLPLPFLLSKVVLKKKKRNKYHFGIDLYINSEKHFRNNKYFQNVIVENDIISKIKTLYDEKDVNIAKILKQLLDATKPIDDMYRRLCVHENYLKEINNYFDLKKNDFSVIVPK